MFKLTNYLYIKSLDESINVHVQCITKFIMISTPKMTSHLSYHNFQINN